MPVRFCTSDWSQSGRRTPKDHGKAGYDLLRKEHLMGFQHFDKLVCFFLLDGRSIPHSLRKSASQPQDTSGTTRFCLSEFFMNKEPVSSVSLCVLRGPDLYMDWDKMEGEPYAYFTFGVCCSEVELDCLTGDYRVRTQTVPHL